jgi:nicotinamide mononucleotide transporter
MILLNIFRQFLSDLSSVGPLEFAGVFFGLISVLYERKGNILVFPTGIVSVSIYVYLCFQTKLYADMAINGYYFLMSVYGWHYWLKKRPGGHALPVTSCNRTEYRNYLLIFIVSFLILYFLLENFTDSDVAVADSLTTAFFFTGMLLLARKKIENWLAWIAGNLISVPLYYYKGLVLTSFQFLVFTLIAISGYFAWKKMLQPSE